MKNIIFFATLFLSHGLCAQHTSEAISDSIKVGMIEQGYDTLVETHNVLWRSGDEYVYLSQVAGGQFRAISHSNRPNVFKFDDPDIVKAWHVYEVDNWLAGTFGANYEGYSCATVIIDRVCTITISGDEWEGTASNDWNAFGIAFYLLLFDPNFSTYLP